MRWPWVSRERYAEMKATLEGQLAERTREARVWADLFTKRATGEAIFFPEAKPEAVTPTAEPEPMEEVLAETDMAEARRVLGPRVSVRSAIEYVERKKEREFAATHRSAVAANETASASEALDAVVQAGRAAAQRTVTQ